MPAHLILHLRSGNEGALNIGGVMKRNHDLTMVFGPMAMLAAFTFILWLVFVQ